MLAAISRLKAYRDMSQEEKGNLLDVLCVVEQLGGGFYADFRFTVPLTSSQIASLIGWDQTTWEKFKSDMLRGKILRERNGSVYFPHMAQTSSESISNDAREISLEILTHWNSKKIVVHKETQALLKEIAKLVRKHEYSLGQVTNAIDNYAIILHGSEYFWTKKWNLNEFLSRGVARFHSNQNPMDTYRSNNGTGRIVCKSIMSPRRECSEFPTEDEI